MAMTKTQRMAYDKLSRLTFEMDEDLGMSTFLRLQVPDAWHTLERDLDVYEKKVRITLMLDESVAKIFRAMGKGYQARINRILATWVQLKIARLLEIENRASEQIDVAFEGKLADSEMQRAMEKSARSWGRRKRIAMLQSLRF